jgi:hypothetical protein
MAPSSRASLWEVLAPVELVWICRPSSYYRLITAFLQLLQETWLYLVLS